LKQVRAALSAERSGRKSDTTNCQGSLPCFGGPLPIWGGWRFLSVRVSAVGSWPCDGHEEPQGSRTNLAASLRNQDIDAAKARIAELASEASLNALAGCYPK
jgi:hypothetical protein